MNLREHHKQTRRDQIVDAAAELIRTNGADGLNMRTLASEAQLSLATVYNLMGGQEAVLAAVVERAVDSIEAALVETVHEDALAACMAMIVGSIDVFEERKAECKPALMVAHSVDPTTRKNDPTRPFKSLDARARTMQAKLVLRAQSDGTFDPALDAQAVGRALYASYIHHLMDWAHSRVTADHAKVVAAFDAALILMSGAKGPARERLRGDLLRLQRKIAS